MHENRHWTAVHGIRRNFLPWARRRTLKSRLSSVNTVSTPSRFAKCTSDASASCIPRSRYFVRIAEIPERSAAFKGTSSKDPPFKEDKSRVIAAGYTRKSQTASVITGQQVRIGPRMRSSCLTHASWCSSDSERIATIGPVSASTGPGRAWSLKSGRIHQNVSHWCLDRARLRAPLR